MNVIKKSFIGAGAAVALWCAAHLAPTNAESHITFDSGKTNITWVGNAVIGVTAPGVVGGPFPRAEKGIEIGLRADGVVVWRKSVKTGP